MGFPGAVRGTHRAQRAQTFGSVHSTEARLAPEQYTLPLAVFGVGVATVVALLEQDDPYLSDG
jgi:hypothetical protein